MNLPHPPTLDPTHSMMLQSMAESLLSSALNQVLEAVKLLGNDYQWHREDCHWKKPDDIDKESKEAIRSVRALLASTHWTVNSLRKCPNDIKGEGSCGRPGCPYCVGKTSKAIEGAA